MSTSTDHDRHQLRVKLTALQRRVRRLRARSRKDEEKLPKQLVGLEHELLRLQADIAEMGGDEDVERGHPALSDVAEWAESAKRLGLKHEATQGGELIHRLVHDEVLNWQTTAQEYIESGEQHTLFEALAETTTRQLELHASAELNDPAHDTLHQVRADLRGALRERLAEGEPVDDEARQVWANEQVDRCDVLLTSIDDMTPDRAAAQLMLMIEDCRWLLVQVKGKGMKWRRMKHRLRKLRRERQERQLQARLESIWGTKNVARFERLILLLIVFVVVLLVVEPNVSPQTAFWLNVADGVACAVFLWEFFFKLALVPDRMSWFGRRFFWDLIPSIPFGLIVMLIDGGMLGAVNIDVVRARPIVAVRSSAPTRAIRPVAAPVHSFRARVWIHDPRFRSAGATIRPAAEPQHHSLSNARGTHACAACHAKFGAPGAAPAGRTQRTLAASAEPSAGPATRVCRHQSPGRAGTSAHRGTIAAG